MEQLIFLITMLSIVGLAIVFGFLFLKIEKDYLNHYSDKDFNSFMRKVKGNSARIKY